MIRPTSSSATALLATRPGRPRRASEIAFIDMALDDRAMLAGALRPGVPAVEFGGAQDGLAQLGLWAHGQDGYDAIHVFCHGEPGRLVLGGQVLDAARLDTPEAAAALAALGAALQPGGALLLYGCAVGAGDVGRHFVAALARAVGATVAASEQPTGAAARGGAWALPVRTGPVPVPLAVDAERGAAWPHLMAVTFDLSAGTRDENIDFHGPVTETTGGLTMSATANPVSGQSVNDAYVWDTTQYGDFIPGGTWSHVAPSNNSVVFISQQGYAASVTVTFDQAVELDTLDFADASNAGAKLRITATNTGATTVVDVAGGDDVRATLHWTGVTGFTITNEYGGALNPLLMDNVVVTPGSAPTTTVAGAALSADTGASSTDFVTKSAAQTVSGTLSGLLASGETVQVSYDNGAHWQDADVYAVGSNAWSANTTLSGSGILQVRVANVYGNGTAYSQAYVVDTTAPNAPSAPDLAGGSDSGASNSDDITANATPTIAGTAESGSTVTLYDTDGSTVLGTATAAGGTWSIPSGTLGQGGHTLTATATDLAGNVSAASTGLAVTIDTAAPTSVALSASSLVTANAGSGAAVGTLSATDATAVTYALAAGNGTDDADNGRFAVSGTTLDVGGSALSAGTYHVYLSATDAAGNVGYLAQDITVQSVPVVGSIVRGGGAGAGVAASATAVDYTVTFSESVTGVDASDFTLTGTGTAAGHIAAVSGSGSTYTVRVDALAGDGTLRLDLNASGTGIQNGGSVAIGGGYTAGATYTLDHTAPAAPSTPDLGSASDTGASTTDDITANTTPTIAGTAESGSTVTLYDSDGTTVLGTTTATGGNWSITASTLAAGGHTLTAKAVDAAGNVSNASPGLALTIDTAAPTSVALSASSLVTANAGSGATVGTLSATDATAVTYALAAGNGGNDADNGKFALAGTTLAIGGAALTAGTYHVYLSATDAAGNVGYLAQTILVQDAPAVSAILRAGGAGAGVAGSATSIGYTVTFSDSVTGVDASDFTLTGTGTAAGHVAAVNGSGSTYTVTVDALAGDGTLRLDLNASGTGIQNGGSVAIGGGYTAGATYTLDHTAPNPPSAPDLGSGSDTGASNSDDVTANATPVITGTAESGSTVTLYDSDGTTVLGTTTATGGNWSITASALAAGGHTLTAKAVDAAGNVSSASGALTVTVDTSAAAPGAPVLAAASDSGAAGDGITNVAAPAVTGTAEAHATVTLYDTDGTTPLGTTTADGTGAWRIDAAALADGVHTLTARQVDAAGNASAASAGLTVTIDTQAPAAPGAPVLDAASDSGTAGDGITSVTRPVIRGTGAAHAVVTLYDTDGTTQLGTATADGAGNWSVTSAALAVGTHTLTAQQADAAGNVSAPGAALALTIAAPPPPPPPAPSTATIDGVVVSAQPVVLPGGGSGTQTVVPVVTPGRVESTGAATVADIPLVQSGGANLLLAQVPVGYGLSATGGASQSAGSSVEHLIQAIVAATPDHAPGDQAHLTGNGAQFLRALAADAPLLVQTIAPVSNGAAPAGPLVLTGSSDGAQHTALVIDATQLAAGGGIALNGVDFAAIVGAASVTGNSAGQILTGDAAAQAFTVGAHLGGAVFAGGGADRLAFAATPAAPAGASGGVRADAAPVQTILHGGLGTDSAVFDGARSAYTVEQHEGYLVVTPNAQPAQHAIVINVESLQFADATVAVANRAELASIAGLYQAILGRQADYRGMDFWGGANKAGAGLGEIALQMIASKEAHGQAGGAFDGTAAHDVALLYQDLFGRAGEAGGMAFWADALAHGATLAQVAQAFATSAEFEPHKVGVAQWDFLV